MSSTTGCVPLSVFMLVGLRPCLPPVNQTVVRRDFITQVELEKRPVPYHIEKRKEALRWLFWEGGRRESGERITSNTQRLTPEEGARPENIRLGEQEE